MKILDRHIGLSLLKGWILVLTILIAVFGLLAFVGELEHVTERYRPLDVLRYVTNTLPQTVVDLSPVIVLLGSLIGLASLARNSEVIAMRAAGASNQRLIKAILIPALTLILTLFLFSEFVAAPMQQEAEKFRVVKRSGKGNLLKGKGLWLYDKSRYFNVRRLEHGAVPTDIHLYRFDKTGELTEYLYAKRAEANPDRSWTLYQVVHKRQGPRELITSREKQIEIGPFWAPDELPIIPMTISAMPLLGLYEYINYLKSAQQRTDRLELSFWNKATIPFASGIMILLALPIGASLSSQRSTAFAKRIGLGAIIGISFYVVTQIIHTLGLMIGLPAPLIALLPLLLTLFVALWLLKSMR